MTAFSHHSATGLLGAMRPAAVVGLPPLRAVRLLDQMRKLLRMVQYSLRTEEAYLH